MQSEDQEQDNSNKTPGTMGQQQEKVNKTSGGKYGKKKPVKLKPWCSRVISVSLKDQDMNCKPLPKENKQSWQKGSLQL